MITIEVLEKKYTIKNCNIVSKGEAQEYISDCVDISMFYYSNPSQGFAEPFLYMQLGKFKSIKLVSCDFKPPKQEKDTVY